jgi:aminoglycoside phosphotransferase (APT) family kinase protein
MSRPPWEADRPLTPEMARAAIDQRFPMIDTRNLELLGAGWEFDAYAADGWVFRFPRRAESATVFDRERGVHELAASALSRRVLVPKVELVGESTAEFPYPFAGHRLIRGVTADALGSALLPTFARDIGAALGAMHAIPLSDARRAGVVESEPDDLGRQTWLAEGLRAAEQARGSDPVVDRALDWGSAFAWPSTLFDAPLRFIHQDLGTDHVIVDPSTGHLVGIIDWTDAIIGDAARDFVFLVAWQGWAFAEEVLRSYPHTVDDGFRHRLDLMAKVLTIVWLGIAQTQGADVSKPIDWVHNTFSRGQSRLKYRRWRIGNGRW